MSFDEIEVNKENDKSFTLDNECCGMANITDTNLIETAEPIERVPDVLGFMRPITEVEEYENFVPITKGDPRVYTMEELEQLALEDAIRLGIVKKRNETEYDEEKEKELLEKARNLIEQINKNFKGRMESRKNLQTYAVHSMIDKETGLFARLGENSFKFPYPFDFVVNVNEEFGEVSFLHSGGLQHVLGLYPTNGCPRMSLVLKMVTPEGCVIEKGIILPFDEEIFVDHALEEMLEFMLEERHERQSMHWLRV